MGKVCAAVCCLLLSVAAVTAQTAQSERALPQWLTGIMALCGFLFLSFVGILVKKAWCEEPRSEKSFRSLVELTRKKSTVKSVRENDYVMTEENAYETSLDMVRSKEERNAYDNVVMDSTDDKLTAM
ncbi:PDZK1-interacting protein 1 isoform X1 [Trematomus bernacchii]|uniref:PDZK1-interacting protein 1 isoform X1 n=1 Tax=Trematomus bernacchii TaxID=40690 RepID=UPI00146C260E|nr:PDZK1-interacting protein 1 isoform X1 [Trematomus bernacchii]